MEAMKNFGLATVMGFSAILALASCGGSSDGGSCGNTSPCGGDIVGTWTIQSSCVAGATMDGGCPGATIDSTNIKVTGTAVYRSDLTYSVTGVLNGSISTTLPPSCLVGQGQTFTCAQLQDLLTAQGESGLTFTCSGTSSCTCVETLTAVTTNETGTYTTTAGGLLTQTPSDGSDPDENDFCVKGNTLTLSAHGDATMMRGLRATITLTKN